MNKFKGFAAFSDKIQLRKTADIGKGKEQTGFSSALHVVSGPHRYMKKPFLTYSQQLDSLIEKKGLMVEDRAAAIDTLKRTGYFALINGYKIPFRDADTKKYREGVSFTDIQALYHFDVKLSSILLRYLLSCERHLKSLFAYHFMKMYGNEESVYLNLDNYDTSTPEHKQEAKELLGLLRSLAREESDMEFLDHYRANYDDVPMWAVVHALTFGQLERLYWCAQPSLRGVICSELSAIKSKNLIAYLSVLVQLRNVCAHSHPIYNLQLEHVYLPVLSVHHELGLVKGTVISCGQRDLFAGLIALHALLPAGEFAALIQEIEEALTELFTNSGWLNEQEVLPLMGFPANWKDLQTLRT